MHNFIKILTLTLVMISSLCGCDNNKGKLLTVGTSADYPPYQFIRDGEIVGMEIDIIKEISYKLGYEIEIVDMDFSGLIPALTNNRIDVIAATMSANEERAKSVDFTEEFSNNSLALIVKENANINKLEDLKDKVLGVQFATNIESFAKEQAVNIANMHVFSSTKIPQLIQELRIGRIDAMLIDEDQAKTIIINEDFIYKPIIANNAGFSLVLPKDSDLTEKFNKIIREMKDNGTIDELKQKWFTQSED